MYMYLFEAFKTSKPWGFWECCFWPGPPQGRCLKIPQGAANFQKPHTAYFQILFFNSQLHLWLMCAVHVQWVNVLPKRYPLWTVKMCFSNLKNVFPPPPPIFNMHIVILSSIPAFHHHCLAVFSCICLFVSFVCVIVCLVLVPVSVHRLVSVICKPVMYSTCTCMVFKRAFFFSPM